MKSKFCIRELKKTFWFLGRCTKSLSRSSGFKSVKNTAPIIYIIQCLCGFIKHLLFFQSHIYCILQQRNFTRKFSLERYFQKNNSCFNSFFPFKNFTVKPLFTCTLTTKYRDISKNIFYCLVAYLRIATHSVPLYLRINGG